MTAPPRDRIAQLLAIEHPSWLAVGLQGWLEIDSSERPPLDRWLGLDASGHKLALRNHYLIHAWHLTDPVPSPWRRSLILQDEIGRYASASWPRDRDRRSPDPAWGDMRTALFLAHRAAAPAPLPATARMIARIVKSAGLYISQHRCDGDS